MTPELLTLTTCGLALIHVTATSGTCLPFRSTARAWIRCVLPIPPSVGRSGVATTSTTASCGGGCSARLSVSVATVTGEVRTLPRTEATPNWYFVPAVSPVTRCVTTSPTLPASTTCSVFAAAAQSSVGEPRRTAYFATPPLPSDTAVHRRVI